MLLVKQKCAVGHQLLSCVQAKVQEPVVHCVGRRSEFENSETEAAVDSDPK